jgi:hypothetical protein
MHVFEPSVLIVLAFSVGGLIAALAAGVVTVDKLAGAWHHSEPPARRRKPRDSSRCASDGRRLKRSRDCPVGGRRKQ